MPLRKEVDLEKTVAAASGVFCDVCSEEPPYHTAEELWEGLKQGDQGARLLFVFFLHLRKNERTRCSVEKAIAAEGKRWVGVLREDAWHLYLLMRQRVVPYQGKPKSVVAVEGSRAQRRILARLGLARYSAPSLKEKAAVRLQTTWNKIHQQWVVLWMDNWYNKQFTTNPDKNDKSLNATALAVLLLKDAPRYWHGHPSLEELERRVPVVARMLGNTAGVWEVGGRRPRAEMAEPEVVAPLLEGVPDLQQAGADAAPVVPAERLLLDLPPRVVREKPVVVEGGDEVIPRRAGVPPLGGGVPYTRGAK